MNDKKILHAYQDRVFALNQRELFLLLHDMRFCSKRIYHGDGSTTLKLDPEIAERLERVFEDLEPQKKEGK